MTLKDDALKIWQAGVDAVRSDMLIQQHVVCTNDQVMICGHPVPVDQIERIEIVGGGKAGAGMTRGLMAALQPIRQRVQISGWVNVPEDCVEASDLVMLHPARPAGINEPTEEGVRGTRQILDRVQRLSQSDLCIVLLSGGGSALLPAPVPEISLADKLQVTRLLARAGASINELNVVRAQISQVKGGGLLRHCNAGQTHALIISDVIGDPLDIIASGPTTPSPHTAADALQVLKTYDGNGTGVPQAVYDYLAAKSAKPAACPESQVHNHVIGSNAVAVAAAAKKAKSLGYEILDHGCQNCGDAAEQGRKLFRQLSELKNDPDRQAPKCLIAGGETTVCLASTDKPRKGGRNQEVVLAALAANPAAEDWRDIVLLSGGTDGEDGPTDAAGAIADAELAARVAREGLAIDEYLQINDSWTFFNQVDGLIRTGPTHTNVMDVAIGLVR